MSHSDSKSNRPFLLALGDCNTEGHSESSASSYPALVARSLGVDVVNCGHTMSTIREGWEYAQHKLTSSTAYLIIQYGLVDSWLTFRGAPYVLYYPDNSFRRFARKTVKRFKKYGRLLGFHRLFGVKHMVGKEEYEQKLVTIITRARALSPQIIICLVATVPSLETHRNQAIREFNTLMAKVASKHHCLFVDVPPQFAARPDLYTDAVHLGLEGHTILTGACLAVLKPGTKISNHS